MFDSAVIDASALMRGTLFAAPETGGRLGQIEAWTEDVELDSIHEFLQRHPGASAAEVARGLSCAPKTISRHLMIGTGHLFAAKGGRWYPIPR
jgi:hypothetical protein